jgi:hypothetical protein
MGQGVVATNVGRVYGHSDTGGDYGGSISDNYALKPMTLEYAASTTPTPGPKPSVTASTSGQEGGDVALSLLCGLYFWKTDVTFGETSWDFNGVNRGYPILRGLGGQ